jgi:hypothetical protein
MASLRSNARGIYVLFMPPDPCLCGHTIPDDVAHEPKMITLRSRLNAVFNRHAEQHVG